MQMKTMKANILRPISKIAVEFSLICYLSFLFFVKIIFKCSVHHCVNVHEFIQGLQKLKNSLVIIINLMYKNH